MAGFPFMAMGAGLGQGAEAIQRQQQAQLQMALQRLAMQQHQQEQEAAKVAWPAAMGGGLDAGQMSPLGGMGGGGMGGGLGLPGATPMQMPQAPPSPPPMPVAGRDLGGGLRAGGGMDMRPPVGSPENDRITNLIVQDESGGRNINQQVVPPGGGYNPSVGRVTGPSSASGLGQFIDSTWRDVAPKVGAGQYARAIDAPEDLQRKAISQRVADKGVGDWAPYNKTLARHLGISTAGKPAELPEPDQTALGAAGAIPSQIYGKVSIQALAQKIEQANPGADPVVKMMALERAAKLLAPNEQRLWDIFKMQHEDVWRQQQLAETKRSHDLSERRTMVTEDRAAMAADQAGQEYFTDQAGQGHWVRKGEPIPPGYHKGEPKAASGNKAINIEVVDPEGKSTYKGAAKQTADGYTTVDGKPIEIPEGGNATITGTGGGRQGATQMNRVTGAANLLSAELKNLSELPAMSAASIFQGLEATPGKDLGEGLKRTMAGRLTPESATDMKTTFQGVQRSVATLETIGAATGLVGLSEQAGVYMPQVTDTVGNVMRKFATLRQILERGLTSAATSRDVTKEQKALFETLKGEVAESIPFTVEDVTKLQTGNQQTYRQLFAKMSGKGRGGAPAEAITELKKDPSVERQKQFDAIFGDGAAAAAIGK